MSFEIESNNSLATANTLTSGVQTAGQASSSSDADYYKFAVGGAGTVTFTLALPASTFWPYSVELFDTSGTLQRSYSTISGGSYTISAQSAGNVYAKVSSSNGRDDYQISATSTQVSQGTTYTLASSAVSVNEGESAPFSLMTNLQFGTVVLYSLSGVQAADIVGGALNGSVTVGSNGQATILVPIAADNLTEGAETLAMSVQGSSGAPGVSASVLINDTSRSPLPIYQLNATAGSVNEGLAATFVLSTTNLQFGTVVSYSLSGVSAADIVGGALNGSVTVGSDGQATFLVSIAADNLTEGPETLTVTAGGSSASVQINDTSRSPLPTYQLFPQSSSVNEGSQASFVLSTTNVAAGTVVPYSLSGVSAADIVGGALNGSGTVGSNGQATILVPIAADNLTEGAETLTMSVQGSSEAPGVSASVLINDTSTGTTTPVLPIGRVESKAYSVASAQASVRSNDGGTTWTVTTPSGTETLTTFDRLRFSDKTIALDFGPQDSGYKTVTMIGAAFGKGLVTPYFGAGVSLFDAGQTVAQIAQLVVSTGLIESMVGTSNGAWVKHIYKNVAGVNPDALTEAIYRTYLDNGTYTKASLLELAAGVGALETQIDLVGIRAEGIGYVPFI
jgi:hypothetical protein